MKKDLVKYVKSKNLFQPNETVIVALSGGVDSMVLFDILSKLHVTIVIAHVNHKSRKASDKEYISIRDFAKEKKVLFEGHTITVYNKENFHQDARNQRYAFFKAVSQKHKARKIIVAHHQDDQVETVLMRLIRGSSFSGYAGIPKERVDRNIQVIRPLIDVKKSDILEYATLHNIVFYEDESNQEDYYTRNRFRNQIIPLLKQENPKLNEHIEQFVDYVGSANIILNRLRDEFLKEHCVYSTVALSPFLLLEKAIQIKVVKYLVNIVTNNTVEISYDQYSTILEICKSSHPNATYSIGKGYDFVKEYECIYITKEEPFHPVHIKVEKEGEYFVDDNKSYVFTSKKLEHNYSNKYELCYNDMVFPLYIRHRKNGDKITLKVGTKKIKDIFIDQKIPKSKRDKVILIANDESVIWIPGIKEGISDSNTSKILYIYEVE